MVATTPWGDVYDEFTARTIPYGFNHQDSDPAHRKGGRDLQDLIYPDQEGMMLGKRAVPITKDFLTSRVDRWNEYYNAKLRIIEGELLDLSARRGLFWHPIMLVAVSIFSFIVFIAVLAVDYAVLSEFWAAVYSNEYGEVPADRTNSVIIKSLQVLVAALAFHFFFQNLTRNGRWWFTLFVFVTTLLFLVGLGFLNAATSLPSDSDLSITSNSDSAADQDRELLDALGLGDEAEGSEGAGATPDEGAASETAEDAGAANQDQLNNNLRSAYRLAWFGTLAMLFVAVTSVAALVLHTALRAMGGLFGRMDNEHHFGNRSIMNNRDMRLRQLRADRARQWLMSEDARKGTLINCLVAFESGYLFGLAKESGLSRWFGGGKVPSSSAAVLAEAQARDGDGDGNPDGVTAAQTQALDNVTLLQKSVGEVRADIESGALAIHVPKTDQSFEEHYADIEDPKRRKKRMKDKEEAGDDGDDDN